MKKSIFILMAMVLGMTACNDTEKVNPANNNSEDDISAIASVAVPSTPTSYLTLSEVEATLIPYGVEEIQLPIGYVPILTTYNEIKCYNDPEAPNYFYYVYVVEEEPSVQDGGPSPFISTWQNNENKKGACYQPGSDCVNGGHYPDGETIIICNPDA
jgi:hypothetical protein